MNTALNRVFNGASNEVLIGKSATIILRTRPMSADVTAVIDNKNAVHRLIHIYKKLSTSENRNCGKAIIRLQHDLQCRARFQINF